MEQRFTVKDFFLFACLALVLATILLAMYMVDRQWTRMGEMQRTLQEQASDLRDLRGGIRKLEARVQSAKLVTGQRDDSSNQGEAAVPPAFKRAYEVTEMPEYEPGDWLVSPFATGLERLTPLVSSDIYAAQVQAFVLESLLVRDPETLEWEGLVARDWSVSEDGLTITFNMREDVKFSDGQPLDASDVVFTFDFIMNERIAAPRQRAYFEKIDTVTAPSQYQVVFKFEEPYFDSLSLAGAMPIMPQHFYAEYLDKPEAFNQSKGLLMGSGPYRLGDPKSWTPDQGVVELQRNPYYWGPVLPSFDTLLWKVIENDAARLTTFRNGDIDLYSARPREYQTLLDDADLVARTKHLEYMSPTAGYRYIGWNEKRGGEPTRFADRRVRQAMTYLTDRQGIVDEIMLGYAQVAVSPFNPSSPQHDPALTPRSFDLDKAKALLKEAGYADRDGDGVLEDEQGQPFEFNLVFPQGSPDYKRIVLFLKDSYARAGILMRPKPTEWSVMIDLLKRKDFDAITLGWSSGIETDIYQIFHSSQAVSGGDDFINYKNERLDALIEKARSTVDEDKRMPLWQKAEKILYEDQPYTFLMRGQSLVFIDDRMHNVEITKLGLNNDIVPVEWYVPQGMHRYTR